MIVSNLQNSLRYSTEIKNSNLILTVFTTSAGHPSELGIIPAELLPGHTTRMASSSLGILPEE